MSILHQLYNKGEAQGISLGEARGITLGKAEGLVLTAKIIKLYTKGFEVAAIAEKLETKIETVLTAITKYEEEE